MPVFKWEQMKKMIYDDSYCRFLNDNSTRNLKVRISPLPYTKNGLSETTTIKEVKKDLLRKKSDIYIHIFWTTLKNDNTVSGRTIKRQTKYQSHPSFPPLSFGASDTLKMLLG